MTSCSRIPGGATRSISWALTLASVLFVGQNLFAQGVSNSTDNARAKIEEAITTLGGAERIAAIESIIIKTSGREHRSAEAQGYHPEKKTDAAHEEVIVASPASERFLYEHKTARHDGTYRWRRWSYVGDERTVADFVERFAGTRRYEDARREQVRRARRIPHMLLLEAQRRAADLRLTGVRNYLGREHDIVAVTFPGEKTTVNLFLDAKTHLLSKYEYVMDFPSYGDTTIEHVYKPYRAHGTLGWFPSGDEVLVAGKLYRDVAYTSIAVNSAAEAAALFALPDDLRQQLAASGSVAEIAPGVFLISSLGSLSPMFVEFENFVLAVEAPVAPYSLDSMPTDAGAGSSSVSEQFIQKIKETIPGKPIKFLVVTHSHSDHAGGARAFIAEGATILTTAGNRGYFERMAAATQTLVPDRLSRERQPLKLDTFIGKRVVTDGNRLIELIDVGPNPHTEENIVVHLPREKIIYQGDLFYFDGEATFPPRSRWTVMPFFARWLVRNKLAPARIYGAHDRGFATMDHVRRVLELAKPQTGRVRRRAQDAAQRGGARRNRSDL